MGDPVRRVHRRRAERPRRVVLIADVSGSMEPYARVYLHLMRSAVRALRAEAFVFATRLTRLTRQLGMTHPDVAYRKAASAAPDWSGGTRIGTALHEFNLKWARRVLGQGAHVLLMTDGLDREDVTSLKAEMERLRRSAKRIVWLNPLLRYDGFEARASGIRVMMPFVDEFRPVHSLNSLADLAETLAEPRRDAHDPRKWLKGPHQG